MKHIQHKWDKLESLMSRTAILEGTVLKNGVEFRKIKALDRDVV